MEPKPLVSEDCEELEPLLEELLLDFEPLELTREVADFKAEDIAVLFWPALEATVPELSAVAPEEEDEAELPELLVAFD